MRKYLMKESPPEEFHRQFEEIPEITRALLYHRGIRDEKEIKSFLSPSYEEHFHDPFLIKDMEKAVLRVFEAISQNENIVIWSDYDHDGIPGGVILHDFFKKIGYQNFLNYIPHRYTEGYGLNKSGIEKLHEAKAKLIISVDCGITDIEPVERANELGIDVVITDHHLPQGKLPPAFAILNSKQEGDDYPFNMLCGASVAWKFVQALIRKNPFGWDISAGWEKWLLDLAGLSTIADMVPLRGENRAIAHFGLKVLKKSSRPGLRKLFEMMRVRQEFISEDDVGFSIAPRINAASRMDDPRIAFDLLTSGDYGTSEVLAKKLDRLNNERKGVVAGMVREMKNTLEGRGVVSPLIVLGNPSWRPGLLGLAANSLVEVHRRPVFLWGKEGGEILKGSCRSDGSVNLVSLMETVPSGIFMDFGGHALSGGFSIFDEKIHYLEQILNEAYEKIREKNDEQAVYLDASISVDQVTEDFYKQISLLAPFGVDNPKPAFLFKGVTVSSVRPFGKRGEHLEISLSRNAGMPIKAIKFFNDNQDLLNLASGSKVDMVGNVELSTFGRNRELRIKIIDLF